MAADLSRSDHERSDAAATPLLVWGGGLLALILAVLFLSAWLLKIFSIPQPAGERSQMPPPGAPRTRLDRPGVPLTRQLEELRSAESALLSAYEWVDRENKIVRIPIDRAMDLIARRGIPAGPEESPEHVHPHGGHP